MRLTLSVRSDQASALGASASHAFDEAGGTIGRSAACDWVLPDPTNTLSSRHATISFNGHGFLVTDTSTNGVYLNQVATPLGRQNSAPLRSGDMLYVGDFVLEAMIDGRAGIGRVDMVSPPRPAAPATSPTVFDRALTGATPGGAALPDDLAGLLATSAPIGHAALRPEARSAPGEVIDALISGVDQPPAPMMRADPSPFPVGAVEAAVQRPAPVPVIPPDFDFLAGPAPVPVGSPAAAVQPVQVRPVLPPPSPPSSPPAPARPLIPDDFDLASDLAGGAGGAALQGSVPYPAPGGPASIPDLPLLPPMPDLLPAAGVASALAATDGAATAMDLLRKRAAARAATMDLGVPAAPDALRVTTQDLAPASDLPVSSRGPVPPRAPVAPLASAYDITLPDLPVRSDTVDAGMPLPRDGAGDASAALFAALGLEPPGTAAVRTELAERLGLALRHALDGIIAVLAARKAVKGEFGLDQTRLGARENNPLKFFPTADDVLARAVHGTAGFMPIDEAVRRAIAEIQAHEAATMAANDAALRQLVEMLDPAAIEADGRTARLMGGRTDKAKAWDVYAELHARLRSDFGETTRETVAASFAATYQQAMARLQGERTTADGGA